MSQQGGFGGSPPPGGFGGPPAPYTPPNQAPPNYGGGPGGGDASTMAIVALALGVISWIGGTLLAAIPGAIIGKMEMDKIRRGESPAAGMTFAQIGFWASVVHLGLAVIGLVVLCCFFGVGLFGALGTAGMQR